MKYFQRTTVVGVCLAAALVAGCASEKKKEAALARVGDEVPPEFVMGAASAALADFDGFSADVMETTPLANGARAVSGELIGRQGRLIFQPWTTARVKKDKIVRGGMFFIWDTASQKGYVLSEALQGYAPISPAAQITNVVAVPKNPASEQVNGHLCHQVEAAVALNDGSTAKLIQWRADDLKRFPMRVRATGAGGDVTVDFSNVRLDLPPPELFVPPSGFTKYASPMALINELMIRESSLKKGPSGGLAEPGQIPDNNWRQPTIGRQQ
jgi:hypothetical protein